MKPYHQMSMRQRINHIPLPDLIVDVVDHTLALDWRQLFSRFSTEEKKKGQITESYPRMPNPYCFIPPLLVYTPEGYDEGYDPVIVNGTGV